MVSGEEITEVLATGDFDFAKEAKYFEMEQKFKEKKHEAERKRAKETSKGNETLKGKKRKIEGQDPRIQKKLKKKDLSVEEQKKKKK